MSSAKPLLVVLGATGKQGGSVLSYFLSLSPSPYNLRGVTRNPTSPEAISLASAGVEIATANFDDPSSLDAAFKGASAIFSVTNFWESFADPSQRKKAAELGQSIGTFCRDKEFQQTKNIIDAAAKVNTLQRFIISSMVNSNKLSGGKYPHVYDYEGKALGDEYGQSAHPTLWEKTSVLYAGLYLENYFGPTGALFRPKLNQAKDTLVLTLAEPLATTPFPFCSVANDIGVLVHALLRGPPGKRLLGVNECLSLRDSTKVLAEVLGKKVEFVDSNPSFELGDPDLEQVNADMLGFWVEFGYDGGNVDGNILRPGNMGVPVQLKTVREWFEKQDWASVLEVE
ncbi:uncharacterized protein BJX67DRAFT_217948 [Aspergillus lucknowensis]|uniref:NmrA-like domain-containing protein n=1 Tax=Aspergillus lucknowensis TaxID=176173 RepID=A0ABR4M3G4_9EURO